MKKMIINIRCLDFCASSPNYSEEKKHADIGAKGLMRESDWLCGCKLEVCIGY